MGRVSTRDAEPELEPELSEPTHFGRSRRRSRCNILLGAGDGVGAEIVFRRRSRSRSRSKFVRLRSHSRSRRSRSGDGAAGTFYSGAGARARAEIVSRSRSRSRHKFVLLRIPGHNMCFASYMLITKTSLTLLLYNPPPRLVFLLSTENGLRWGLEISSLFQHIHWECCTKFLSFYFAQRRLQDHFLGGMFAKFRPIFSLNFRKL